MSQENKKYAVELDTYKNINNNYSRKVIFATNVAESSITFDGLVYVIDSGFELAKYFNAEHNSYVINKQYTTQAQIKQRIGRVGRNKEGIAYHLYSEKIYNDLYKYPSPSINNQDITEYVLSFFKNNNLNKVLYILNNLITPPTNSQIILSLYKLIFYKMIVIKSNKNEKLNIKSVKYIIDNYNNNKIKGKITKLGKNILHFKSIKIISSYAIILSNFYNCLDDIVIIISILEACEYNMKTLFIDNDDFKDNSNIYFSKCTNKLSDHITLLNIYNELFLNNKFKFLNKYVWEKISSIIKELKEYNKKIDIKNLIDENEYKTITNNRDNNIIFTLMKSFSFNLLKENKNEFENIFYYKNKAKLQKLDFNISNVKNKYGICDKISQKFGKTSFECITYIHNDWNINLSEIKFN